MNMRIAFLFSGQGAQYPGMLRDLYESELAARSIFDCADRTLERSISEICFTGPQEELMFTHNTQPCVLAADLAAAMVLRSHGVEPAAVAGFSLGEYAALCYADAVSVDQVFPMIQFRADAMQDAVAAGEGAMAAVIGVSKEKVEEICAQVTDAYVTAANYNSPKQTVVSGTAQGVDHAERIAKAQGISFVRLAVSAPFHCELMKPAARKLETLFETIEFSDPKIPVYMNVDGYPVENSERIPEHLVKQAMSPVLWTQTLEHMHEDGFDTFIECGPGKTLSGLVKKTLRGVSVCHVESIKTLQTSLEKLGIK